MGEYCFYLSFGVSRMVELFLVILEYVFVCFFVELWIGRLSRGGVSGVSGLCSIITERFFCVYWGFVVVMFEE